MRTSWFRASSHISIARFWTATQRDVNSHRPFHSVLPTASIFAAGVRRKTEQLCHTRWSILSATTEDLSIVHSNISEECSLPSSKCLALRSPTHEEDGERRKHRPILITNVTRWICWANVSWSLGSICEFCQNRSLNSLKKIFIQDRGKLATAVIKIFSRFVHHSRMLPSMALE